MFRRKFSRKRRPLQFEVELVIHELTHIPLREGVIFIKWKTHKFGGKKGVTDRIRIKENKVSWEQSFTFQVILEVDNESNILESCPVRLSVRQETAGGKNFERLGVVNVDLAEYAGAMEITRKYLLQDSRVNSSLKVTLRPKQLSGDPTFKSRAADVKGNGAPKVDDSFSNSQLDIFANTNNGELRLKSIESGERVSVGSEEFSDTRSSMAEVDDPVFGSRVGIQETIDDIFSKVDSGGQQTTHQSENGQ